jgi:enterochelin esterase-like enzyme
MRIAALLFLLPLILPAQSGKVERIQVHAKALEANLLGDSADRSVSIYLPPSYEKQNKQRFPVVYLLHGFTDDDRKWFGAEKHWINLTRVLDKAFAAGAKQFIVVMPNGNNAYGGAMYSTSAAVGDWERFLAEELVAYVDSHYRTLARSGARGLAGHSMGGYGALRVGMRRPEVFSSLYLLSPCCLIPQANLGTAPPVLLTKLEKLQTPADVAQADFMSKLMMASAAAWSPNPARPPVFVDLPTKDGQWQWDVVARWAANAPLAWVDANVANLRRLTGLAFDAGDQDKGIAATIGTLDERLNIYKIPHQYEIYSGNHVNHIADRIETKLVPFFADKLR